MEHPLVRKTVLTLQIILLFCFLLTTASAESVNISEIRDLIPAGMDIDEQTINELFHPEPIVSEADTPFIDTLSSEGFEIQQGAIVKVDFIKLAELGMLPDAEGNNADNPYYAFALPRSPGQTVVNDHEYPNEMSRNFRLKPDEAVLMIGKTPSGVLFYNYPSFMIYRTVGSERAIIFAGLGDSVNIGTVKAETGTDGFDEPILMIYSADKTVAERVKSLALAAGYPESMIHIKEIPSPMVNMGLEEDDDSFAFGIRTAVYETPEVKDQFMSDVYTMYRVYRLTPNMTENLDPYPVPDLRIRGTGKTEFDLMPSVKELREAIIAAYPDYSYEEMETGISFPESPQVMQNNEKAYGENRDAAYLGSEKFTLNEGQFAVSYGVNHMASGKAVYSNIVAYGAEKINGVISVDSTKFEGGASRYIPDDPNAPMLYAYLITRTDSTEPFTVVVPQGPYLEGIPLDEEMWIGWRAYMEPETNVGPTYPELVYDKVIVFTPR